MNTKTKPAIKVTSEHGFVICREPHELARCLVGEYGTKAEFAAIVKLWSRFIGKHIETIEWPPPQ